jgi:hypothetical protein
VAAFATVWVSVPDVDPVKPVVAAYEAVIA